MKTLKRALCLLLTLTMLVGMFTMVASADGAAAPTAPTAPATYSVILHGNYPNGGDDLIETEITEGETLYLSKLARNFSAEGYTFDGWATSPSGKKAFSKDTDSQSSWLRVAKNGVVELYALWAEVETQEPDDDQPGYQPGNKPGCQPGQIISRYTIDVIINYNRGISNDKDVQKLQVLKYADGTLVGSSLCLTTPTREGYVFKGWTINGKPYNGERLTGPCVVDAQWERKTGIDCGPSCDPDHDHIFDGCHDHWYNGYHTVIYTDGVFGQTIFKDQVYKVKHNAYTPDFYGTPIRAGYKFAGWSPRVSWRVTDCVVYTATWVRSYATTPKLTTQHIAYIQGDPDGEVRPLENITRAEAAAVLYRLLSNETLREYRSYTNPFTDVAADAWYNDAVSTLYNAGIITGNASRFNPEAPITRAELVSMLARFSVEKWNGYCNFRDVKKYDWFFEEIGLASQMKIITGDEYGFRPNDTVLRCEAVTMINRALGRDYCSRAVDNTRWVDNPMGTWYYAAMVEAGTTH